MGKLPLVHFLRPSQDIVSKLKDGVLSFEMTALQLSDKWKAEIQGTWENGKTTHQSRNCCGSCGNLDAVTGQKAGFHPSARSGQSWTFSPH